MDQPHEILNYNYIDDGIYIGTNQCCQVHFDQMLMKDGVTVDISLEDTKIDQPFGVESYLWLPVKDHEPPTQDQLALGVALLGRLVALKKKVYVHCKNGHGRAPTLVAAFFLSRGMSFEAVEPFIKSKRPSIHLQDSQREALKVFARNASSR